jgi:cytochrome c-type biogenesis protein CcmH/NrfG
MFFLVTAVVILGCSSNEEKKATHFQKGEAYFDQGDYKSARLEYKNAIKADPEFTAAYLKLGETNLKLGHAQEAFSTYSRAVELDPDNTDAQLKLATFYLLAKVSS